MYGKQIKIYSQIYDKIADMNMKKEIRAYTIDQLPRLDKYEIAFLGRSNCGKSSLINRICNTSKARVSQKPGHTLWIGIHDLGEVRLMDLPGYGYASVGLQRKEMVSKLVWEYLSSGRVSRAFILIDTRRGILPIDQFVIEALDEKCIPMTFIGTKVDKKDSIKEGLDFYCSSHDNSGVAEIMRYIKTCGVK